MHLDTLQDIALGPWGKLSLQTYLGATPRRQHHPELAEQRRIVHVVHREAPDHQRVRRPQLVADLGGEVLELLQALPLRGGGAREGSAPHCCDQRDV
jgi:hypothetical protein